MRHMTKRFKLSSTGTHGGHRTFTHQGGTRPSAGIGRAVALAAIAAATLLAVQTGTAVAAGPAMDAGSTTASAAAAYRVVYPQMSSAAATKAATQQQARKSLYDTVTSGGEDDFGGAWFDPPSGVLHVTATTSEAAARTAARGRQLGLRVETRVVARSFAELERQADELRSGSGALSTAAQDRIGIDVVTNRVVAAVPAAQREAIEEAGVPAGVTLIDALAVSVEPDACTSRSLCDTTLRAGTRLWRAAAGANVCSQGFTARITGTNSRATFTAGHCSNGVLVNWGTGATSIGPLFATMNLDSIDASYIPVTNAVYLDDIAGQDRGGQIFRDPAYGGTVAVDAVAPSLASIWAGDTVCLAANATEINGPNYCGVVTTNSDPLVRGMVKVDGVDACGGDSGGGWYSLAGATRSAYGVHSRSNTGCHGAAGGDTSWFSPVPTIRSGFAPGTDIELR